jgi:hypothetical protein
MGCDCLIVGCERAALGQSTPALGQEAGDAGSNSRILLGKHMIHRACAFVFDAFAEFRGSFRPSVDHDSCVLAMETLGMGRHFPFLHPQRAAIHEDCRTLTNNARKRVRCCGKRITRRWKFIRKCPVSMRNPQELGDLRAQWSKISGKWSSFFKDEAGVRGNAPEKFLNHSRNARSQCRMQTCSHIVRGSIIMKKRFRRSRSRSGIVENSAGRNATLRA